MKGVEQSVDSGNVGIENLKNPTLDTKISLINAQTYCCILSICTLKDVNQTQNLKNI